jgi:hypothetical protein
LGFGERFAQVYKMSSGFGFVHSIKVLKIKKGPGLLLDRV